MDPLRPWN